MKTKDDYLNDISKQFIELNNNQNDLIELRKEYADDYMLSSGDAKEKYQRLLKKVDEKRKQNRLEAKYLRDVRSEIEKATVFKRDDILKIIAYLVSVIENEEYQVYNQELPFFIKQNKNVTGPLYYNFAYLSKKNNEDSQKELNIKYPYALSAKNLNVSELFNGNNYLGLCLYKMQDSSNIIFTNEVVNTISLEKETSYGYLNSNRFSYIKDFLDSVINYRVYLNCEFAYPLDKTLEYEELYNLANEFIDKYQLNMKEKR